MALRHGPMILRSEAPPKFEPPNFFAVSPTRNDDFCVMSDFEPGRLSGGSDAGVEVFSAKCALVYVKRTFLGTQNADYVSQRQFQLDFPLKQPMLESMTR